jgi:hypothetical protein
MVNVMFLEVSQRQSLTTLTSSDIPDRLVHMFARVSSAVPVTAKDIVTISCA